MAGWNIASLCNFGMSSGTFWGRILELGRHVFTPLLHNTNVTSKIIIDCNKKHPTVRGPNTFANSALSLFCSLFFRLFVWLLGSEPPSFYSLKNFQRTRTERKGTPNELLGTRLKEVFREEDILQQISDIVSHCDYLLYRTKNSQNAIIATRRYTVQAGNLELGIGKIVTISNFCHKAIDTISGIYCRT